MHIKTDNSLPVNIIFSIFRCKLVPLFRLNMTGIKLHIARLLVFIVAMQILNLSIYMQDFEPIKTHHHTIGEVNEINSIVEYFAEVVLEHKGALPEYKQQNNDHTALQVHKHAPVKMITFDDLQPARVTFVEKRTYIHPLNEAYYFLFFREINPPPPKA